MFVHLFCRLTINLSCLVMQSYLPRSILIPLSTNNPSNTVCSKPPRPVRHDKPLSLEVSFPLSHVNSRPTNYDQPRNISTKAKKEPDIHLINSSHHLEEENERIYINQLNCRLSAAEIDEPHQYASIDFAEPTNSKSIEQEQV